MKNFSVLLNIILLIAVGGLYYIHFSEKKPVAKKEKTISATLPAGTPASQLIAYVELDSLNENIHYIRNKRKELEAEQKGIETEWENSYKSLEAKKNNFLKKGNAITQEMAQQFQSELLQEQQQVDEKKQTLTQHLSDKSYKFMDDVQKKLKEFLADYNEQKNYKYIFTTGTGLDYMVYKDSSFNITADVIAGMNEKMDATAKQ